jgi:hypothetical protein
MQTHVEMGADNVTFVTGDDEGVLQNPADDVITGLRDLGFVADEDPCPTKNVSLLQLEDLPVVVDVGRDHASSYVIEDSGLVGHDTFLLSQVDAS